MGYGVYGKAKNALEKYKTNHLLKRDDHKDDFDYDAGQSFTLAILHGSCKRSSAG